MAVDTSSRPKTIELMRRMGLCETRWSAIRQPNCNSPQPSTSPGQTHRGPDRAICRNADLDSVDCSVYDAPRDKAAGGIRTP